MALLDSSYRTVSRTRSCQDQDPAHSCNDKGTVVIVDDEPFILRVLTRMLVDTSYAVVPCQLPSLAIERVLREDVVLVVSDMTMPEMSGLELLRKIRKFDARMPVVVMTGRSDPESVEEALECGANEYLIKPFDISKFRQTVQRLARPKATEKDSQVRPMAATSA